MSGPPPGAGGIAARQTAGSAVTTFRELLADRMGWRFADGDLPHLLAVLDQRSAALDLSRAAYLGRLAAGGWSAEIAALTDDLTITETYFFRHGEQFRALAEVALPERVAARGVQRALRLLSVGCSSGEEAYTLAIVANRAAPGWLLSVLGVDANPAMLRKAAAARYSAWSLRETPDDVRQRCFQPRDGDYEVDAEIRRIVRWKQYNVAGEDDGLWPPEQYDVIFCRNLLMYLTPGVSARLVQRMTRSLAPGGYLFLGHTDSLGSRPEGLEPQHSHSAFYYRRPVLPVPAPAPRAARPVSAAGPAPRPPAGDAYRRILGLVQEERFGEALAEVERRGPGGHRDLLLYGVLLAQAGRVPDATAVARRLVDADGMNADAHHLLGMCLEADGSQSAAGQFRLAAYVDPGFAMPRFRLGLLARRRGDDRAAATDLDRALHLLRDERDERLVLFGGGFGRIALTTLCRAELDACGARR
jgi:chemotaxis protein methyltransferase CheR